jgi:hypothetical protein
MATINEKSAFELTFIAYDEDGTAITPATARYQIHDKDSGTELLAWTTLTPATEITVQVPSPQVVNAMVDSGKPEEIRVVTVQFNQGLDTEHNDEQEYTVRNLQHIS